MSPGAPIGWLNTGLPVALFMLGAVVLPRILADPGGVSQIRLAGAVLTTALALVLLGVLIFALIYQLGGKPMAGMLMADTGWTARYLLRLSARAAVFWGPVLALVWFARAQGVERRKGEAMMREGRQ